MQNFRMNFDKPDATYQPGETVTGNVLFDLTSSITVKVIQLEAYGKAKVSWKPNKYSNRGYPDEDYPLFNSSSPLYICFFTSKEDYHIVSKQLFGSDMSNKDTVLTAGQYVYPFTFQLPNNIPCTFEHHFGHVRYTVEAIFVRPRLSNSKVESPFKITLPDYTSTRLGLTSGISEDYEHEFGFCCCSYDGTMKINVTSSRGSRFIPGAMIELIVNYDGTSTSLDISHMLLKLKMRVKLQGTHYVREEPKLLARAIERRYFGKTGSIKLKITVPSGPFPRLEHCSIMATSYQLMLYIYVSGLNSKSKAVVTLAVLK